MPVIQDSKILIISTNGFEQSELEVPRDALRETKATVHVASLDGKSIKGWDGDDWGDTIEVDTSLDQVKSRDYDALVIPGGQINPDILRVNQDVLNLVKDFHNEGKVVAAICHGPWLLVETGIAKGRKMTSYKSIRTDVENAGGQWVDEEVVADKGIVTSRSPADLKAFVAKIIEEVQEGLHDRQAA